MKKKIILLIGMLLFLCGCTADVNLVVDDNYVDETISITMLEDSKHTKSQIANMYRNYYPIYKTDIVTDVDPDVKDDYVFYYDKTSTELESGYLNKYHYKFDISKYRNAKSIDSAFKTYDVEKNYYDKAIYFSTDDKGVRLFYAYPDLEVIRVRITPKNEVLEANVEPVNGVYTWTFTQGNNNKNIYLKMKMNEEEKPEASPHATSGLEDKKEGNDSEGAKYAWLYAIGGVIVFIIFIKLVSGIQRSKYN